MKLKCCVKIDFCFYLRCGKEIPVNLEIKKEYDENSEEYQNLCREKREAIGFDREEDKDEYDRLMLENMSKDVKEAAKNRIDEIIEAYKKVVVTGKMNGYACVGTHIINLSDVSAIQAEDFSVNISKK